MADGRSKRLPAGFSIPIGLPEIRGYSTRVNEFKNLSNAEDVAVICALEVKECKKVERDTLWHSGLLDSLKKTWKVLRAYEVS